MRGTALGYCLDRHQREGNQSIVLGSYRKEAAFGYAGDSDARQRAIASDSAELRYRRGRQKGKGEKVAVLCAEYGVRHAQRRSNIPRQRRGRFEEKSPLTKAGVGRHDY